MDLCTISVCSHKYSFQQERLRDTMRGEYSHNKIYWSLLRLCQHVWETHQLRAFSEMRWCASPTAPDFSYNPIDDWGIKLIVPLTKKVLSAKYIRNHEAQVDAVQKTCANTVQKLVDLYFIHERNPIRSNFEYSCSSYTKVAFMQKNLLPSISLARSLSARANKT